MLKLESLRIAELPKGTEAIAELAKGSGLIVETLEHGYLERHMTDCRIN